MQSATRSAGPSKPEPAARYRRRDRASGEARCRAVQGLMQLVLASTSRYRRQLLGRLGIPFSVVDPGVAEEYVPGEAPEVMARRLAEAKSLAVASRFRDALIIGCDQVAVGNGDLVEADDQCIAKPARDRQRLGFRKTPRHDLWRFTGDVLLSDSRIHDRKRNPESPEQLAPVARGGGENKLHQALHCQPL